MEKNSLLKFEERRQIMYFITISEMIGANGEKISRKVANELKYNFLGEEELLQAASEMGFLSDIKKLDEKSPALFERFFSDKPKIYLDRLQSLIYEVAKKGNTVFFGRGAQFLLRSFDCAFHVLITASIEKRIQRLIEERPIRREFAEKIISQSDHDRRSFIRYAYDEDWLNFRLYDLIINTDKLSVDSAANMIIEGAKSDEIRSCGIDSVRRLENLSIHRQVESALIEEGLMKHHIFFEVEGDRELIIYGIVDSQEDKDKVEKILNKIKGIKSIKNDIVVYKRSMSGV